jgi:glucose-6-phosphate 1-dehydrogenase
MKIQPEEGLSLSFQAKRPGSKLCMGTLNMDFSYESIFGIQMPEAYQRLLLDCMIGDQTLFMRFDTLETSWRWLEPVLNTWEDRNDSLFLYSAGVSNFPEADRLIQSDGRQWRPL